MGGIQISFISRHWYVKPILPIKPTCCKELHRISGGLLHFCNSTEQPPARLPTSRNREGLSMARPIRKWNNALLFEPMTVVVEQWPLRMVFILEIITIRRGYLFKQSDIASKEWMGLKYHKEILNESYMINIRFSISLIEGKRDFLRRFWSVILKHLHCLRKNSVHVKITFELWNKISYLHTLILKSLFILKRFVDFRTFLVWRHNPD